MKVILALACAAGLGVTSAAAQTAQSTPPAQSNTQQNQQNQSSGSNEPKALQNVVSMSGCVYQTSDQPTLFAIKRMDHDSTSASSAQTSTTDRQSTTSSDTNSTSRSTNSTDTHATQPGSTGSTEGAWYRLTQNATQNLKQYVGQRVQVNGQLTPGRDTKGNDIVIHRITPDKTVVTAIDLQPAPQLSISSITPLSGTCTAAQDNQDKQ
jgi:hypothetical protein